MKKGQTLVSLIVVIAISIIIVSSVLGLVISNSINTNSIQQSNLVRNAAESGMENALLRLLRDPEYNGETLSYLVNGYNTVVTVTGDGINKTIVSTATSLNYQRKILVKITYNENVLLINLWQDSE
jgi:type II secretory pathway pseudopilin PulG